jgi:hypothetical protein
VYELPLLTLARSLGRALRVGAEMGVYELPLLTAAGEVNPLARSEGLCVYELPLLTAAGEVNPLARSPC